MEAPSPRRGEIPRGALFHGLRFAPPVATLRFPSGAEFLVERDSSGVFLLTALGVLQKSGALDWTICSQQTATSTITQTQMGRTKPA